MVFLGRMLDNEIPGGAKLGPFVQVVSVHKNYLKVKVRQMYRRRALYELSKTKVMCYKL